VEIVEIQSHGFLVQESVVWQEKKSYFSRRSCYCRCDRSRKL